MDESIEEYNQTAREWNDRFGHLFNAIIVNEEDIYSSTGASIKNMIFSSGTTARQKLKNTEEVSSDFASNSTEGSDNELSKGELAFLLNHLARKARKNL